jgi:hypothetical protein
MDIEPKQQPPPPQQPHSKKERSQVDDLISQHMEMLKQQAQVIQLQQQQQQSPTPPQTTSQQQQPPQIKQQEPPGMHPDLLEFMKQTREFIARQQEREKAAEETAKQQKREAAVTEYMSVTGAKREDAEVVIDGSKPETVPKVIEMFKAQKAAIEKSIQQPPAQENKKTTGHTVPPTQRQSQPDPSRKILNPPILSPNFIHAMTSSASAPPVGGSATAAAAGVPGASAQQQQPYAIGEDVTQPTQRQGIRLAEGFDLKNLSEEQKAMIMQAREDKGGMASDPFLLSTILDAMRRKK